MIDFLEQWKYFIFKAFFNIIHHLAVGLARLWGNDNSRHLLRPYYGPGNMLNLLHRLYNLSFIMNLFLSPLKWWGCWGKISIIQTTGAELSPGRLTAQSSLLTTTQMFSLDVYIRFYEHLLNAYSVPNNILSAELQRFNSGFYWHFGLGNSVVDGTCPIYLSASLAPTH